MKCPKCGTANPEDKKFCGDCGTSFAPAGPAALRTETVESPREALATGSMFAGRYQIIEELGHGGMGRVYKARDTEVDEKIALKLIKPEIAGNEVVIERFRNELKLARRIRHPGVCQMFDLNKSGDSFYITMEYVRGDDLKSLIRRMGRFSEAQTIHTVRQICDGLAEAHRLGVVHRDLKPQNVMVDQDGQARIMDFGIARSAEGRGLTGLGVMIGTPEYMSPEQVEGGETDRRSDLYSLGVILFEMVTGRTPFEGGTPFTIGVKHKSEPPPDPRQWNEAISDELRRIIFKCLEKDPERRYRTAEELRDDLTALHGDLPTHEKILPAGTRQTSRELTVKLDLRKLALPIGAALVLAAALVTRLVLFPGKPRTAAPAPSGKPSVAVMYFKNNTGDESLNHWRTMLPDLLTADLTQSRYIRVLGEDKVFDILSRLDQTESQVYSSETLREVAAAGRVDHILQGAYARAGDEFRIHIMLLSADTLENIGSETISGQGEQSIFRMVDELTRRIKTHFALTAEQIDVDIDKEVGIVTTGSPEALRHYSEGIMHDRRGEYREELASMEKAVAIDPGFASAYHAMSWAYQNLFYYAESRKVIEKALALSDRLSDRERLGIQGSYYTETRDDEKALEALTALIELYPDDIFGHNQLGILYGRLGQREKAIEHYRAAVEAGTEDVVIYTNLSGSYRDMGMHDEAVQVCESYLDRIEDSAAIRRELSQIYRETGNVDRALFEADRAVSLDGETWMNLWARGDAHLYGGDWAGAERDYRKMLETRETIATIWGLSRLWTLDMLKGRYNDARDGMQRMLESAEKAAQPVWVAAIRRGLAMTEWRAGNPDRALEHLTKAMEAAEEANEPILNALRFMGFLYLETNRAREAEAAAVRLETLVAQSPNPDNVYFLDFLRGSIAAAKKNYAEAVPLLRKARSLLAGGSELIVPFTFHLATVYYEAGRREEAAREFEEATRPDAGLLSYGDLWVESFYMAGKVHEELGATDKAAEYYRKYLDLRKDADPGLPGVQDARARLAKLG